MDKTLWVVEKQFGVGEWQIHDDGDGDCVFHKRQNAVDCARRERKHECNVRVVPFDRRQP